MAVGPLRFVRKWLLDEETEADLHANWENVYESLPLSSLPPRANLNGAHIVFKLKDDDHGQLTLKVRSVLQGYRDCDRYSHRRNSASADLPVIRLVLSFATILNFNLVTLDVRGAYMQCSLVQRNVNIRLQNRLMPDSAPHGSYSDFSMVF